MFRDEYTNFSFNGLQSENFKVWITNKGDLQRNMSPNFSDKFNTPTGSQIRYHEGTTIDKQDFKLSCAAIDVTLSEWGAITEWLSPLKSGKLRFEWNDNYYYMVKISRAPSGVMFMSGNIDSVMGQLYTITFTLEFTTVHDWAALGNYAEQNSINDIDVSVYNNEYNMPSIIMRDKYVYTEDLTEEKIYPSGDIVVVSSGNVNDFTTLEVGENYIADITYNKLPLPTRIVFEELNIPVIQCWDFNTGKYGEPIYVCSSDIEEIKNIDIVSENKDYSIRYRASYDKDKRIVLELETTGIIEEYDNHIILLRVQWFDDDPHGRYPDPHVRYSPTYDTIYAGESYTFDIELYNSYADIQWQNTPGTNLIANNTNCTIHIPLDYNLNNLVTIEGIVPDPNNTIAFYPLRNKKVSAPSIVVTSNKTTIGIDETIELSAELHGVDNIDFSWHINPEDQSSVSIENVNNTTATLRGTSADTKVVVYATAKNGEIKSNELELSIQESGIEVTKIGNDEFLKLGGYSYDFLVNVIGEVDKGTVTFTPPMFDETPILESAKYSYRKIDGGDYIYTVTTPEDMTYIEDGEKINVNTFTFKATRTMEDGRVFTWDCFATVIRPPQIINIPNVEVKPKDSFMQRTYEDCFTPGGYEEEGIPLDIEWSVAEGGARILKAPIKKLKSLQGASITWTDRLTNEKISNFVNNNLDLVVNEYEDDVEINYALYVSYDLERLGKTGNYIEFRFYKESNSWHMSSSIEIWTDGVLYATDTYKNLQPNEDTPAGLLENRAFIDFIQDVCDIEGGAWEKTTQITVEYQSAGDVKLQCDIFDTAGNHMDSLYHTVTVVEDQVVLWNDSNIVQVADIIYRESVDAKINDIIETHKNCAIRIAEQSDGTYKIAYCPETYANGNELSYGVDMENSGFKKYAGSADSVIQIMDNGDALDVAMRVKNGVSQYYMPIDDWNKVTTKTVDLSFLNVLQQTDSTLDKLSERYRGYIDGMPASVHDGKFYFSTELNYTHIYISNGSGYERNKDWVTPNIISTQMSLNGTFTIEDIEGNEMFCIEQYRPEDVIFDDGGYYFVGKFGHGKNYESSNSQAVITDNGRLSLIIPPDDEISGVLTFDERPRHDIKSIYALETPVQTLYSLRQAPTFPEDALMLLEVRNLNYDTIGMIYSINSKVYYRHYFGDNTYWDEYIGTRDYYEFKSNPNQLLFNFNHEGGESDYDDALKLTIKTNSNTLICNTGMFNMYPMFFVKGGCRIRDDLQQYFSFDTNTDLKSLFVTINSRTSSILHNGRVIDGSYNIMGLPLFKNIKNQNQLSIPSGQPELLKAILMEDDDTDIEGRRKAVFRINSKPMYGRRDKFAMHLFTAPLCKKTSTYDVTNYGEESYYEDPSALHILLDSPYIEYTKEEGGWLMTVDYNANNNFKRTGDSQYSNSTDVRSMGGPVIYISLCNYKPINVLTEGEDYSVGCQARGVI